MDFQRNQVRDYHVVFHRVILVDDFRSILGIYVSGCRAEGILRMVRDSDA